MRRKDREITDINAIEKIIAEAGYMHIGLFDGEYPYVVPMHYGYEFKNGRLTFYMHSAAEGHKLDCIKKNANVFVEIDVGESLITADIPCGYGAEYKSVMCRGSASIVEDTAEKIHALSLLMKTQTGDDFEITEQMANAVSVIRVDVDSFSAKACLR